jgi:hypothetical protein
METKPKKNYIIVLMLFLFIIFIILYISKETGYYEYKVHQKTVLTEEAIIQFEKDVAEGKNVKASDYITENYIDYSNKITKISSFLGRKVEGIFNNGIKKVVKVLLKLFWE